MKIRRKNVDSIYDGPIQKVLTEMEQYSPEEEQYKAAIAHLETLTKLKAEERPKRIDANTMLIVGGNLLGILLVVAYEQKHVMTTKSIGFTLKPKSPHI